MVTNDCSGYLPGSNLGLNNPPIVPQIITKLMPHVIMAIPVAIPMNTNFSTAIESRSSIMNKLGSVLVNSKIL